MTSFCVAWFSWLYFEQAGYVLTLQSSAECWFQWPVARSWFQFLPRVSSRLVWANWVFGLKKIGWFWAGYLYHGNWRYTATVLFWVTDCKPKLDQSAVSKVPKNVCNEAAPPYLTLQMKAVYSQRILLLIIYLFILIVIVYNSYNIFI